MSVASLLHRPALLRSGVFAALLAALLPAGCEQKAAPAKEAKPAKVVVTTPITQEVTDYQDFTGRLDAVKTVEVRARVSGYAIDIPFKEGDRVNEGDLLCQIDSRPYKAQLDAIKAQVATSEAGVKLADVTYKRARDAADKGVGVVSLLELDQDMAQQELARASLKLAQANLATAQLNWDWTQVKAPITGRISRRNVDPGNLIMADNTVLTTIVTEDPLYAYFDVDERTFLDLVGSTAAESSQGAWLQALQFPVLMRLANQDEFAQAGLVNFVDNRVVATTGTIRMRGVFKNPLGALKPGLFVRIRLPIGHPYKAILIPDRALQSDQGRKYLFVVNDEDKVVYRPVQLGQAIDGLRVIKQAVKGKEGKEGLAEGERVIVEGMQRVRAGTKVEAEKEAPPKPPRSPLGQQLTTRNGRLTAVDAEGETEKTEETKTEVKKPLLSSSPAPLRSPR